MKLNMNERLHNIIKLFTIKGNWKQYVAMFSSLFAVL